MVNRKGIVRIVEATIAILLIFGTLLILSSQRSAQVSETSPQNIPDILDEVARDESMRRDVLLEDEEAQEDLIENFLESRAYSRGYNYSVELCELSEPSCYLAQYPDTDSDVYVYERVISTTLDDPTFAPKRIKVFVWRPLEE